MRKLAMLMACTVLFVGHLLAQTNRTVTGKVLDDKGLGLAGVTVSVQGGTAKSLTQTGGSFSISVPSTAKNLEFSYVGFATYTEAIPKSGIINVSLKPTTSDIEGVVITGYTKEKKSQFTGAATTLGTKSIENVPVASFDQNFQGRIPGLLSNSGSGQPGYNTRINIRGISSITAAFAQPLFVIDGVPIASNDLATINADDFESITVLKDAGAAAMYGARGGLGVVVITTKKGKAGQTNFSYRTQLGFTQKPNPNKFSQMNSRQMLDYEEFVGGFAPTITAAGWYFSKKNTTIYNNIQPGYGFTSVAQQQARFDFIRDSLANNNEDYYDLFFRTGKTQSHELAMSGGNAQTKYYLSLGYFDQDGVDRKSRLERYTTRFNLDHTTGNFTAQFNGSVGFSKTYINEGVFYAGSGTANPFAMVWRAKPYEKPYRSDGTLITGASTNQSVKAVANLLDRSNNSLWIDRQLKAIAGLTLSYKLTNELSIRNTTGIDAALESFEGTINANSYTGTLQTYQSGLLNETYRNRLQLINTSSINYGKKMGDHEFEVGAYFEVIRQWNKGFGFSIYNLDPRLTNTGQGAGTLTTGGAAAVAQNGNAASSGYGIRSYFATARYSFKDKYSFNANVRRDGTSRIMDVNNREITSWSTGASWNTMKESFMQKQSILTDLKLRATYGIVPNISSIATGSYGIGSLYYTLTNYWGTQMSAYTATSAFPGSTLTASVPTVVNPNLKIETINKANIGVDFAFWQNRLRFTVDFYKNVTKDLFVSQPLPSTAGAGANSLVVNAGTMSNKGIDFVMNVDVVKKKDVDVTLGFNHSINKNNIDDLGAVSEYQAGTGIIRVGIPYGTHFSYNYLGADPATGRPTYMKQDGVTTTTNVAEAGSFANFGTWMPKHVGGFNLDVRYKRFFLSALFSYQFDVVRSNNAKAWYTQGDATYTGAVTQSTILLTEQWQKPGDIKMISSPAFGRGLSTSYDLNDAKFLRFRNLSVSYQIPAITLGNMKIKSSSFYIQGQNLAIWSPWVGLDPEDDNNVSLAEFPNPRAVVVGLNINF